MKSNIRIEWLVETLCWEDGEEYPDITGVSHFDTLKAALAFAAAEGGTDGLKPPCHVGLVRDRGNDLDGLVDRQWAYIKGDGMTFILPARFSDSGGCDGSLVPTRYHREVKEVAA
jgi:hypothetical protein